MNPWELSTRVLLTSAETHAPPSLRHISTTSPECFFLDMRKQLGLQSRTSSFFAKCHHEKKVNGFTHAFPKVLLCSLRN